MPNPHLVEEVLNAPQGDDPDPTAFDNLDNVRNEDVPLPGGAAGPARNTITLLPPEQRPLHLPSRHCPDTHPWRKTELSIRIKQADRYLAALREAVAEKSFQYSHVMRKGASKTVKTRSRSVITLINSRITAYSRIYGRTRAALVRLGADEPTLNKYLVLHKDDVRASSAILDPNEPGSTTIQLSWIWQTRRGGAASTPEAMRECESCGYPLE
jgi:hypothetical protein